MSELLLEYGADSDARTNGGETPLFMTYDVNICCLLVDNGVDPLLFSKNGDSTLHNAARRSVDLCNFFLKIGVNVNARNKAGKTPLHYVSNKNMCLMLLEMKQT